MAHIYKGETQSPSKHTTGGYNSCSDYISAGFISSARSSGSRRPQILITYLYFPEYNDDIHVLLRQARQDSQLCGLSKGVGWTVTLQYSTVQYRTVQYSTVNRVDNGFARFSPPEEEQDSTDQSVWPAG